MATAVSEARAKISKIFNGKPQSYTLFNTVQDADGDASRVEVKLSGEGEEDMDMAEVEHCRPHGLYPRQPLHTYRNVLYFAGGVLFIFLVGFLIGYMTHRTREPNPEPLPGVVTAHTTTESKDDEIIAPAPVSTLDWSDIKSMLQNKLSPKDFENRLSEFALESHKAGSVGDETLANKVLDVFKSLDNRWTDEHYVQLQAPSRESPNTVAFDSEEIGRPQGYLAYSATGTEVGKVMYANYGRMEDLKYLKDAELDLGGSVVLMREGEISFAQKVANAAQLGAVAVLIYQEPAAINPHTNVELYGHVHLGTGDPYTPGFPSFNHTQFPPAKSSGLPEILAQTITADMALKIHKKMGGKDAPEHFKGRLDGLAKYTLGGETNVTVTINNVLVETKIHNVFGVIQGYIDPDRYVVIGAQRDSFGQGYAKSTVGTCLLVELAKAFAQMKKEGFRPRRSIIFASWSAGDYGSIGSTEWLEGYLPSLNMRAFTYISLDGTVSGADNFKASASPLLHNLLKQTMNEVKSPLESDDTLYQNFAGGDFETNVLEPMKMEDGAYPFLSFSGIPSVSFRFVSSVAASGYRYYGTLLDTEGELGRATNNKLPEFCVSAAQVAGQMALRLVHDHLLKLDVTAYARLIRKNVIVINKRVLQLKQVQRSALSTPLTASWLIAAQGSYGRAANALVTEIANSDLEDNARCRNINDRIMRLEHNLLSPYVSPRDTPFRHIIFGSGDYTVTALTEHLKNLKEQVTGSDADLLRNQFALTTWTVQSCANDLAGNVWDLDNQI